jgi:alcohol dehydrogenase class IV
MTIGLPGSTATTALTLLSLRRSYTSNDTNMISDMIAKEAISLIGRNLTKVIKNGSDLKAREGVQLAATLAGMSIMGPFCNVPHEIGLMLGMIFHMPHGTACGITLPEALEYLAPVIPDRIKTVAQLLGASVPEDAGPKKSAGLLRYGANVFNEIACKAQRFCHIRRTGSAVPEIMNYAPFHFSPRR